MNNIIKTALIVIFTAAIMALMLEIINVLIIENEDNKREYYLQNSATYQSGLIDFLNTVSDEEDNSRINTSDGINYALYGITLIATVLFPLFRKLNRKNCSNADVIAFGIYTSVVIFLVYSFIEIVNSNSINFLKVFNMMTAGLGIGIAASFIGIAINLCIEFISKAKQEGFTLVNTVLDYKSSFNNAAALSSAGIWLLIIVCVSIMAFLGFIV